MIKLIKCVLNYQELLSMLMKKNRLKQYRLQKAKPSFTKQNFLKDLVGKMFPQNEVNRLEPFRRDRTWQKYTSLISN